MNPELSRRVGRLMQTRTMREYAMTDTETYLAFVHEVEKARDFSDLSPASQAAVLAAEAEIARYATVK